MKHTIPNFDQNSLLRTIFDNLNDGINVVDENGILIFTNEISAKCINKKSSDMLNKPINIFYPGALLLDVIKTNQAILDKIVIGHNGKKYVVSAYPVFVENKLKGGFSVFKNIDDADKFSSNINSNFENIIGADASLKEIIIKSKKVVGSLGGPRHSIITGQSGTGKTLLAHSIYLYAKQIGRISDDAPFIEVNCAQYTNPDLAAVEIFGSEKGAFTGSIYKKGLFEQANGGILFLDEAHALENYQTMLLKAIESSTIRRIGGSKKLDIDVILIAASTKNLKEVLLPELYQRLAQYELYLPSLSERTLKEKKDLLIYFTNYYEKSVNKINKINLKIKYTSGAEKVLLESTYPRNIRQFRDVINASIDSACPLISDISSHSDITICVDTINIPLIIQENIIYSEKSDYIGESSLPEDIIRNLRAKGLGPRKIANFLNKQGYNIEYYHIAYFLKKYAI